MARACEPNSPHQPRRGLQRKKERKEWVFGASHHLRFARSGFSNNVSRGPWTEQQGDRYIFARNRFASPKYLVVMVSRLIAKHVRTAMRVRQKRPFHWKNLTKCYDSAFNPLCIEKMFSPTKRVCSFALKLSLCGPLSMETDFISTPKFTQKVCVSWCYATYGKIRIPARHPSIASLVIPTFHPNLIGLLPLCCQLEEMLSSRFFFFLLDSEALPPSFRYKTGGIEQNWYGFSISPG